MENQKERTLDLGQLRDKIDTVDAEIVRLFEARMAVCE